MIIKEMKETFDLLWNSVPYYVQVIIKANVCLFWALFFTNVYQMVHSMFSLESGGVDFLLFVFCVMNWIMFSLGVFRGELS